MTEQKVVQMVGPLVQPAPAAYVSFTADFNPFTAQALIAQCAALANGGVRTIHLLLSTPGGLVREGMTAYNVLRGLPVHLVTHNVGNVDSVGNVVFLAGEERYACANATFMFHGVGVTLSQGSRFEERNLLESLGNVRADTRRMASVIAQRANFPDEAEIGQLFLEASTRDADYAKERGIIHDIREVEIPAGHAVHQLVFQRQGV